MATHMSFGLHLQGNKNNKVTIMPIIQIKYQIYLIIVSGAFDAYVMSSDRVSRDPELGKVEGRVTITGTNLCIVHYGSYTRHNQLTG